MKYYVITFGCQFNKSDSERAAGILEKTGYTKDSELSEADLVLVLACSVRQTAVDRLFGLKMKFDAIRQKRPLVTVLAGCILPSDEKKLAEFFDLILPSNNLLKLPKLLKTTTYNLQPTTYSNIHPTCNSRFQAYVPIMSGCDNFCAYCVVPYTRGREVSRPAGEAIAECRRLIEGGRKFITLIGQNVNSYGKKTRKQKSKKTKTDFPWLLKKIDAIPGEYWLSFATSHPKDLSDELIKTMAKGKHIMPYLHLPVQSGDDEILRKMNRRYTARHYLNLVKKARKAIPGLAISTDVIVGFPGETKRQFLNTAKLFKVADFDLAFIARYSPRPGTAAAQSADDVPLAEKKSREKILTAILAKTALANNKKLVGRRVEVLVKFYKNGFCFGRTRNFKNIKFACDIDQTGKLVIVEVIDTYAWGLLGRRPKVLAVLGATASGKTKLAVKLAKRFNGEIISADSRQVYRGMDIGTGKDLDEYGRAAYHLIDAVNPKEQFTVADWQKAALAKIDEILKRGKTPIICGGTGLYISALTEGYLLPAKSYQLKAKSFRKKLNRLTLKQLLNKLKEIDPKTYETIDKNNRRRVQRALEIYYETGRPKSEFLAKQKPPYDFLLLGLTYPREVLKRRIEKRLKERLEKENMVSEIRHLRRQGVSWKRLEEFGLEYRFVARYLQKKIGYEQMAEQLNRAIADFAKRQLTWFRRERNIVWLTDESKIVSLVKAFLK